jgi:hypothetical protein
MNTINKLNDILPEDTDDWTDFHIEEIIKWQQQELANYEAGVKPKRLTKEERVEQQSEGVKKALENLIQSRSKAKVTTFKRRI